SEVDASTISFDIVSRRSSRMPNCFIRSSRSAVSFLSTHLRCPTICPTTYFLIERQSGFELCFLIVMPTILKPSDDSGMLALLVLLAASIDGFDGRPTDTGPRGPI